LHLRTHRVGPQEVHARRAAGGSRDLDTAAREADRRVIEALDDGLLGCPAARQLVRTTSAVVECGGSEGSREESRTGPPKRKFHPLDGEHVDALPADHGPPALSGAT